MGHKPFVAEKAPSHRPAKFAERVKQELVAFIPGELRDPRVAGLPFFTITSVTVTPDLRNGTVLFALMGDDSRAKDVEGALNDAANFIKRELMKRLNTKSTPLLHFKYDKGLENTETIDGLLKTIKK